MRLASAYKSISFTFRNPKTSCAGAAPEEEQYDFVLPPLVKSSLDYLNKHGGVNTEGIFRVSGSMTDIEYIAKKYAKGKITPLDTILNIHTVAGLLKHYIRNRRGGLIPTALRQCVLAAGNIADENTRICCISRVMKLLPANNKLTLTKICEYLYEVQKNESINKMSVYNLSLIFSSTFLPADSTVLEHAYTQTAHAHAFTETLIRHQHVIFTMGEASIWEAECMNDEYKAYIEMLTQHVTSHNESRANKKKRATTKAAAVESNNELQKMAILNLSRKNTPPPTTTTTPPTPTITLPTTIPPTTTESGSGSGSGSESPQNSPRSMENKYLDIIVAEKMCRREEVDLLSQCLMLGEPELFMQHLERVSKGDSNAKDTIQKAAIKMCRNPHRRKISV